MEKIKSIEKLLQPYLERDLEELSEEEISKMVDLQYMLMFEKDRVDELKLKSVETDVELSDTVWCRLYRSDLNQIEEIANKTNLKKSHIIRLLINDALKKGIKLVEYE